VDRGREAVEAGVTSREFQINLAKLRQRRMFARIFGLYCQFLLTKLRQRLMFARTFDLYCTSQVKVDTQTRKYTPKLFGRAFDIVLESDNSMRTQAVLRCRT
jgi:hypothetical protein